MSPEQAAGSEHVGPLSDVFSLGVVLFELVSGRRPYIGADAVGLLARIVLDEAPRLHHVVPELPAALDELVARALRKDPAERFPSALAMAEALTGLSVPDVPTPGAQADPQTTMSAPQTPKSLRERRVVTTLFARGPATSAGMRALAQLERLAASHGGDNYRLLGRRLLCVFGGVRSSGDEVLRAARIALATKSELPALSVAIATGHAVTAGAGVSGQVIDRGSTELDRSQEYICVDALTARMLEDKFVLERKGEALALIREQSLPSARRLLGHDVPLLERDRELAALEDLARVAVGERRARSAVVRGPAGIGKTRLAGELKSRLATSLPETRRLTLQGDPMRAGVPFATLTHALQTDQEAADRISKLIAGEDAGGDPTVLAQRVREAVTAALDRLAAPHGMVLLIEDAQWADTSTMDVLGWALDALADRPLCVIAFGRPEIDERFAALWSHAMPLSLSLAPLSQRAVEELARLVMGPQADPALSRKLATRSDGNPLFVEELIRSAMRASAGRVDEDEDLPPAIQAAFQVRLDALLPIAKTVVLAGSVLGRAIWDTALETMLPGVDVARACDVLLAAEILAERPRSRFAGARELVFRHSLLHDAAYALLPDEERRRNHGTAARWLQSAGEDDHAVLAFHFERAGLRHEAASHYLWAAQRDLRKAAPALALEHAERGLGLTPDAVLHAQLRSAAARALHLLGRYDEGLEHSRRGLLDAADPGTRLELAAVRGLTLRRSGRVAEALECIEGALTVDPTTADSQAFWRARADALLELGWTQYTAGKPDEALASARAMSAQLADDDAALLALRLSADHLKARALLALGDLQAARDSHAAVVDEATRFGHHWRGEGARHGLGETLLALADIDGARETLSLSRARGRELRLPSTEGYATVLLSLVHLRSGDFDEAARAALDAAAVAQRIGAAPLEAACSAVMARLALDRRDLDEASRRAESALRWATGGWRLWARALQAAVDIERGAREAAAAGAAEVAGALLQGRDVLEAHDHAAALALHILEEVGDPAGLRLVLEAVTEVRLGAIEDEALRERVAASLPWITASA
jgi:tetratricopeptide (TPR) repeat protein